MRPHICETVTGRSMAELVAARDACRDADLVELRVDGVSDLDVAGALKGRRHPVVVTCRPVWEGGRFDGAEAARLEILQQALDLGAEYVDIEFRAGFDALVRQQAARVVLSLHDFHSVPDDLPGQARLMRAVGAGLIKIAVTPQRLTDLLPLREVASAAPAVVIGMGITGLPTRLLAAHFGSRWSYAGHGAAPGQIPASRMVEEFRFKQIDAGTAVYGVVGNNVMHSLSPAMHNAAFTAAGIDAVYVPLLPADFADFLDFATAFGLQGASVTIPFKRDALNACIRADAAAAAVGAANTLTRTVEGYVAGNTDVDGFLGPLDAAYPAALTDARAAVLGAGGSARAAVVALRSRGAHVTVHARRAGQAEMLAGSLGVLAGPWPVPAGSWDLLVNCTPAGSAVAESESPLPGGPFEGRLVYDLTYRLPGQGESPLLKEARAAGCHTLDGLPMLVAQAERQFERWTGAAPPPGVMAAAVDRPREIQTRP
jgi:3-dehydroquinate dehydratase/shikimate dehydrogenase